MDTASDTPGLRPELEALPQRLRKLPVDARGYPVPFFVAWIPGPDGVDVPEFRAMDPEKWLRAVKERRCWICGEPLGRWLAFPIGPMCTITRTTAEPPSHRECADWSIRNCPFLSKPRQARRDNDFPMDHEAAAGHMLARNPGVIALWMTRTYDVWNDGKGKPLITVGAAESVSWWREGRPATRGEVEASVADGLPVLLNLAKTEGAFAVQELGRQVDAAARLYPVEAEP